MISSSYFFWSPLHHEIDQTPTKFDRFHTQYNEIIPEHILKCNHKLLPPPTIPKKHSKPPPPAGSPSHTAPHHPIPLSSTASDPPKSTAAPPAPPALLEEPTSSTTTLPKKRNAMATGHARGANQMTLPSLESQRRSSHGR